VKLAIDSSVLLAIFKAEPGAEKWLDALVQARRRGPLVICEVVYAELAPAFAERDELETQLSHLGARLEPIGERAAWLAGTIFKVYRLDGGPRKHLIPDFLVAAHAKVQADQLAATDRGYLRRYFPDLQMLEY
jgi:predicted nucleic acid-binding protein